MQAAAYVRVSTDRQDLGPEAQRASIEAWARREGVRIHSWNVDRGVSGGAELERRPELMAAIEACKRTDVGILVAAKRDRLARDVVLCAMLERLIERAKARIVTCDGVSSEATPEGELMRRMVDAFAAYERQIIGVRTRAALQTKIVRGERVGGIPYGFRLADDGVRLEPDDDEVSVIELITELRARGLSIARIADALEAEGVPSRGRRWHATTVRRILVRGRCPDAPQQHPGRRGRVAGTTIVRCARGLEPGGAQHGPHHHRGAVR